MVRRIGSASDMSEHVMNRPGELACPACGAGFRCGAASGGCWCAELRVPAARLREIETLYAGCLCARCLVRLAAPESPAVRSARPA
jgi:hypothetical protein